jgi:MraZ protein
MYLGQHRIPFRSDLRLTIPEPYRDLFAEGAFITRGFEENLLLLSNVGFQELYRRAAGLNIADPHVRLLLRLIIANASEIEISTSGDVLIPEDLKSFTGPEQDLILVGQGEYLELWTPEDWEKQTTSLLDTAANANRFTHLDLALH